MAKPDRNGLSNNPRQHRDGLEAYQAANPPTTAKDPAIGKKGAAIPLLINLSVLSKKCVINHAAKERNGAKYEPLKF